MAKEKLQAEQLAQAKAETQGKPEQTIYIGPSLKGLKSNSIFTGGLPETGKDLIGRNAKYRRLFVPLSEFIKRTKELKTGGLGEIYKAAAGER